MSGIGSTRRAQHRLAVGVLAAAMLSAACAAAGDVRIERSEPIEGAAPEPDAPAPTSTDAAPSTTTPSTDSIPPDDTILPDDTVPTTPPDDTTPTASTEPPLAEREPELGVGDELFPDLGSSDLDVQAYIVRLDATDPAGELSGSVEIITVVEPDVSAIALDSTGPTIEQVTVDGLDTSFVVEDGGLLIDTLPEQVADGEAIIDVTYRVTPQQGVPSSVGLPLGWIVSGDGAYVLNQPDGASSWVPSNDHPSDRAFWRFEITAQAGHVVSANGDLLEQPATGEAGTWVWQQAETMPTYLVHLVVGDYELLDGGTITGSTGTEIALTHLVPTGTRSEYAEAIETVPEQIEFFEERFGPYPLEHYGLAFAEGLSGLAMETQGRSLFGASDFAGRGLGFLQELLLSHELAHQWFGNAVTPAEWDDLWLNESFATYAQWLWLEERGLQPLEPYAERVLQARQQSSDDATGEPGLANLFGFERYDGGAAVVHALRLTIGDDAFFDLLRRWVGDNAETARTTEDFIALAEEVGEQDLEVFFDDWLFAVVPPASYPE